MTNLVAEHQSREIEMPLNIAGEKSFWLSLHENVNELSVLRRRLLLCGPQTNISFCVMTQNIFNSSQNQRVRGEEKTFFIFQFHPLCMHVGDVCMLHMQYSDAINDSRDSIYAAEFLDEFFCDLLREESSIKFN